MPRLAASLHDLEGPCLVGLKTVDIDRGGIGVEKKSLARPRAEQVRFIVDHLAVNADYGWLVD